MALINCIKCGREYSNELDACPHCQFKPTLFKCPECGRLCTKNDAACAYCGYSLSGKQLDVAPLNEVEAFYHATIQGMEIAHDIQSHELLEKRFKMLGEYADAPERAKACRDIVDQLEREEWKKKQYDKACELLQADRSYNTCVQAADLLKKTEGYGDSEKLLEECEATIQAHKTQTKKRTLKIVAIIAAVIAAIFIALLIFSPCTISGHKYDSGKITKEPTCSEAGIRTFTCTRCDDSYTEPMAPTGDHDWTDWETTEKATYDHAGEEQRVCKKCGEVDTSTIEQKERPASYYKDEVIINEDGKYLAKVYCMDGTISFNGSFNGSGNFIVEVLDSNQDLEELVCNEIGSYVINKSVYVGTGWHYIEVLCGTGTWEMTWYGTGGN